ncbi:MAG: hypothetical protein K6T29_00295 [Peptococcaceae bacterium]|nr:hypothetical protein [Peptococcaceae bacterium]
MGIIFKKEIEKCTYLDPFNNFQPLTLEAEKRYDSLTGDTSLVVPFKNVNLPPMDWSEIVAKTKANCPFCPERRERTTPRFTGDFYPDGRIVFRGATVIPNLSPYERYSAVVIMSDEHYLDWPSLSLQTISDSFQAGLLFLQRCAEFDPPGASYCSINWNYMPYSGGTLVHPHLQVLAGNEPTNYHKRCLRGALQYFEEFSSGFWSDLISAEKEQKERYLGSTGQLHWMTTFAPRALADVTVVFAGCRSLKDIDRGHFDSLAGGLLKVFQFFVEKNIPGFNFSLFLTAREQKGSLVTGRLAGRFPLIPPAGSDMSYLQVLHGTPWTVLKPEELKDELISSFKNK